MNNNTTYNRVVEAMHLRRPQHEALDKFHKIISKLSVSLNDVDNDELKDLFKKAYPEWSFEHEAVEFTFHLATGVGKTRLIGAVIAYLFLSGESRDFMIVSPRSEIVRKFKDACGNEKKYLFVDPMLVDYPTVFDSESNVSDYEQGRLFGNGPRIWIISPQSLSAKGARMKRKFEIDPCSPVDYLSKLRDLVVFFDESHHLSQDSEEDSVWQSELNNLSPKLIIGTTAYVEDNQNNIIYSYDLKRCLNEHLYTKFVRMMPDKKPDSFSDDDYDKLTLRFALQRLETKQKSIDNYCSLNKIENKVKAAMLVACEDINHAERTTLWLQDYLQSRDAVLLVHSKLGENEYLPKLKEVEDPGAPVKVIVNVGMLNEGWDVSNIYVIAPLRAMASATLVTQIMGRGLRLPFGKQVGDDEVDTLDVLCFGHETMQEIVTKLTEEGFGTGERSGITVEPSVNAAHPEETFVPKKKIRLKVICDKKLLTIPQFKLTKERLPLELVTLPGIKATDVHYFLINDPKTIKKLGNNLEIDRIEFIGMVTTEVLRQCTYLRYSRDFTYLKKLIDRFLNTSGFKGDTIKLDPLRVVTHIKENLDKLNKQQKISYVRLDTDKQIDLSAITISVPESYQHPNSNSMPPSKWNNRTNKGIPFGGWVRCCYEAVPFDTRNEYHIARIIDTAEEVKSWFRNLPEILTLLTPVGSYSPDFAILLNMDDKKVLLELKDDDRFGREDQDATIKANAAREWCRALSEASNEIWEYWLLLDTDAESCETFEDIEQNSDRGELC